MSRSIMSRFIMSRCSARSGACLTGRAALLEELQHRRRLVESLLVLVLEARVGDDAAAGPEPDHAAGMHQRADRDVDVHAAVEAEVADGPAIDAAPLRLELLDDLHRAQLGRARDRAAGEAAAQQVDGIAIG